VSAPHPSEDARIAARRESWRKSKRSAAERKAIADELLNRDLMRILETPGPEWRREVILAICQGRAA